MEEGGGRGRERERERERERKREREREKVFSIRFITHKPKAQYERKK
jgi:hypothetical protein